jgi:aminomethyltransferase
MSREVHNGPTDATQARGTSYSGDPEGGAGARRPELDKLPLDAWHRERGGRMVPFAGYEMPVQYEGIMAEHLWTRENAGLFDVSHMGQLLVHGENVDEALETLMPGDFRGAADMKPKYSLLLDDDGGIIDDLMATRRGTDFYVVVNDQTRRHRRDAEPAAGQRGRRLHERAGAACTPGTEGGGGARDHRPGRD